jgi:hypothetical protein
MALTATLTTKRSINTGLIVGLSLVVITLVLILLARPDATPVTPAGAAGPAAATGLAATPAVSMGGLIAREASFDFGSISMGAGKVSHRYWLSNEGGSPVFIKRIYTSCMCTVATFVKGARVVGSYGMPGHGHIPDVNQSIAPGEAAYLDVAFDPAAHGPAGLGRTERFVTIDNGGGQRMQLRLVASVRP